MPGLPRMADGAFRLAVIVCGAGPGRVTRPGRWPGGGGAGGARGESRSPRPRRGVVCPRRGQAVRPRRRSRARTGSSSPPTRSPKRVAGGGLPPRLVRRQSGVLRRLDRPPGPQRATSWSSRGIRTTSGRCRGTSCPTPWPRSATPWRCSRPASKHVRPDLERFALIGHSAGGNLAAQIAAVASDPHSGLPQPRAVIALMPGEVLPSPRADARPHPAPTLLIVAVGEDDLLVGDLRGRQIFAQASRDPPIAKAVRPVPVRPARLPPHHRRAHGAHGLQPPARHRRRASSGRFQMSLGDVNAMDRAGLLADRRRHPRGRLRRPDLR